MRLSRTFSPTKERSAHVFQFRRKEAGQESAKTGTEAKRLAQQQRKRLAQQQRARTTEIIVSLCRGMPSRESGERMSGSRNESCAAGQPAAPLTAVPAQPLQIVCVISG
jgi:hypothetical protein